jgi:hypothetical protein
MRKIRRQTGKKIESIPRHCLTLPEFHLFMYFYLFIYLFQVLQFLELCKMSSKTASLKYKGVFCTIAAQ